ncbi:type III pantothenate kinase [Butyrivibrio sp. VCD2006]|uniref:type III pantothenate kinase n=1 Tax=Butyrivibrio sp. VCD2006 TaxID=1280664 RepID=UPI000410BBF3|nr:type III pantothenate kinase [Butyrivibrio sp. VCD2006]
MILAIDVGNTNIVLGGVENGVEKFSVRLATDRNKTADQYALDLQGILNMHHVEISEIEGGIISSVVPYLQTVLPQAVKILTGIDILVVGPDMDTGLDIRTDNPKAVGSDLIVGAVAARAKYKLPIAIVDMGTATTMTVIDENGSYIGGMIMPGLWVSVNALSSLAAQLPNIDLTEKANVLGTNTVDSMRSGALIGCAAMLDGIIDRVEEELGKPVSAVLTGGVSSLVAPYCKRDFNLEPDILIRGLQLLYDRNKKA